MNKLNAKLKAMKCQNARIARKIILKNESSHQNSDSCWAEWLESETGIFIFEDVW